MVIAAMAAAAALFTATGGQAVSPAPLLGASKVSGPPPKPGLWTLAREDCRFNLRAALTRWPDCADPLQVGETALSRPSPDKAGAARRFRYSPGDPGVLQVETGRGRIWPAACPRAGCRVRTAEEVLVAVRRAEAAAFEGGEADAGRTAVWARRSQ